MSEPGNSNPSGSPAAVLATGTPSPRFWWPLLWLIVWGIAAGLALWGQSLLLQRSDFERVGLVYGAAAIAAMLGVAMIERLSPLPPWWREPPRVAWERWFSLTHLFFLLASLAAIGWLVYLLAMKQSYPITMPLWLAGLASACLAMRSTQRWNVRPLTRAEWVEVVLLVGILVLAVVLRLPSLEAIPPEVHGDEAACGIEGRRILHGEVPNLFTLGWYHIPYLSFAISASTMWLFGDDLFGLRMASVIQGTLSILLTYLIARRLFSVRVAMVAAFLLAVSHWHIHFSRSGISYMQALLATVLVLHFLLRGLERLRRLDFLLAGFAVGLCVNVYYAARLAPFLAVLYLLYRTLTERGFLRRQWRGFVVMILGIVLFLAPLGVVYATHPETLMTRTSGVLILSDTNLKHALSAYKVDTLSEVLRLQAINTLTAFNLRGETSMQHSHRGPLIDFGTSAFLVMGVASALLLVLRSPYFLLVTWFWLTLVLGSMLTVDAMFSPRVIAVLPALFLFPALFIDSGWRAAGALAGRVGVYGFGLLVLAFLAQAARDNYDTYFEEHIKVQQPAGFNTSVSRYVLSVNDRYRVYLMGKADTSLRYDTEALLLPDVDGVDVRDLEVTVPLDRVPAAKGVAFIVADGLPNTEERLARLRAAYPRGVEKQHLSTRDFPMFHSYAVERADLLAARPDALVDDKPIPALTLPQLAAATAAAPPRVAPRAPASAAAAPAPPPAAAAPAAAIELGASEPLREPRDLTFDAEGGLFLLDRLTARVYQFAANGEFVRTIGGPGQGPGLLRDPRGVAVEKGGTVLVLDSETNLVSRFAPDGHFLAAMAMGGGYHPNGLALDEKGNILVADTGQSRIVRMAPAGAPIEEFGHTGQKEALLDQPTAVAVGENGEIYVVDSGKGRIAVYGPDLKYRRGWQLPPATTLFGPHIAVGPFGVVVSDPENRRIARYDTQGRLLAELGRTDFSDVLQRPQGVAVDRSGKVYVADAEARTVQAHALP